MVPRSSLPYLGVIGLGVAFAAGATAGLVSIAGEPGLGPGLVRVGLAVFLVVGAVGVVVASLDLYRTRRAEK